MAIDRERHHGTVSFLDEGFIKSPSTVPVCLAGFLAMFYERVAFSLQLKGIDSVEDSLTIDTERDQSPVG